MHLQLQFERQEIPCLHTLKRETQIQEQTQELRISDGMPDAGSIIGVWGQPILRGKEWLGDGMTVSGGTMVWIQYQPEEGGQPQCLETWLPFQMRWDFPQAQHDGTIFTQCILRSVDARTISARKMMVRTNVSVTAWAMERGHCEIYAPGELPDDVQLLTKTYPVQLPAEAGEKAFSLEENLSLPPSAPVIEKLLHYRLVPEITEEKLMGDKIIFRGNAQLHILYASDDGGQYAWDFDLPFTQYGELEDTYGDDAQILLWPCVTALEVDKEENGMNVKVGLVCQFRVSHRPLIQVVEDAYSPRRGITPVREELELPGILEEKEQVIPIQQTAAIDGMRLTDVEFTPFDAAVQKEHDGFSLKIPGQFQLLYYDMEGNLRTHIQRWEHAETIPSAENVNIDAVVWPKGVPQGNLMSGSAQVSSHLHLTTQISSGTPVSVINALELGELVQSDPQRPSLVIRRSEGKTLWELAKEHGSTVNAIRESNGISEEPDRTQMLLIPVT